MHPGLTGEQRQEVSQLLIDNADVFSGPDGQLGRTSLVKHNIDTRDHPPIKQPLRRAPYHQQARIEEEVESMIQAGVVEESSSPWSSPIKKGWDFEILRGLPPTK